MIYGAFDIDPVRVFPSVTSIFDYSDYLGESVAPCLYSSFNRGYKTHNDWKCGHCSKPVLCNIKEKKEGEVVFDLLTRRGNIYNPSITFCSVECAKAFVDNFSKPEYEEEETE